MVRTSIFKLSDQELIDKFGESRPERQIKLNADIYASEIVAVLASRSTTEIQKLKLLLGKLEQFSTIHRGKIFQAFGDIKKATSEYRSIQKGEDGYSAAQYRLLTFALSNPDQQGDYINNMIQLTQNLDTTDQEHGICCMLVGDALYKEGRKQESLEWYLRITESSPDYPMLKDKIPEVYEENDVSRNKQ